METTLKIQVKNCGNAAGTLGWFKEIIFDSEIIIRKTKTNEPGLFLHRIHKADGTENSYKEGNKYICGVSTGFEGAQGYQSEGSKYIKINVFDDQIFNVGFSQYALTPACEKAINSFIDDCMKEFIDWFEKQ
jgi:hypothetical protein